MRLKDRAWDIARTVAAVDKQLLSSEAVNAFAQLAIMTANRCAEIAASVENEPDCPNETGWRESAERIRNLIGWEFGIATPRPSTPKSDSTASTTHENPKLDNLTSCPTDLD